MDPSAEQNPPSVPEKKPDQKPESKSGLPSPSIPKGMDSSLVPWAFLLPFVVMMVLITFYPKFDPALDPEAFASHRVDDSGTAIETIDYIPDDAKTTKFIVLLGAQIVIAAGFFFYFRRLYLKQFPFRLSTMGFLFGAVGIVVWIGLCIPGIESNVMQWLGISEKAVARPAFNPFAMIDNPTTMILFFTVRFGVLVVVVPFVEELFLRGWLIRWVDNPEFWTIRLASVSMKALAIGTLYGVLAHPAEMIASIAWFSLISWLMVRTGNFWDCVVAHAVTNLLLGLYVVYFSAWQLW